MPLQKWIISSNSWYVYRKNKTPLTKFLHSWAPMLLDGSLNTNLEMFWKKFNDDYSICKITNEFWKHGGNDCGVTG